MAIDYISPIAETLGTARWIGTFENNSPEWHAARATGIGGSDVGTIAGCNPWQSPFTLWARRTGKIEDTFTTNEAMEWGTRLESVVLDKFADMHPELFISRDVGTWAHQDRDWQLANPDAIAVDTDGNYSIVEIKTARYEDDWVDGVPQYYRTQVQWYMQTFGFKRAHVAVLFSGSKYREFVVEASEWEQEINLRKVEEFRVYLETDTQPDYDGASDTYATIRKMHPDIEPKTECDLGDLGMYYQLAVMEAEKAETHLNEMKSRVLDAMGSTKRGTVGKVVIVERTSRNGGTPYLVNKKG